MEKIIKYENLNQFAYVNDKICTQPIQGIVVAFFGLGSMSMFFNELTEGEFYGEKGILYVVPYNNPWAWMNKQAVRYTDEILDVLIEKYQLSPNIPIVSTGGSMGGQSALVYSVYSKRTPVACVSNCPVCDVVYHFTERVDLPRTLYSAIFNEEGTLEEALKTISPLHLLDKMPKIPYYIFHCNQDNDVNIKKHSQTFVQAMEEKGYQMTFHVVEGRGHCNLTYPMKKLYAQYILDSILK